MPENLSYIRETWRVSYKKLELLTLLQQQGSSPLFGGVRVAHIFGFLCCVFFFVCLPLVSGAQCCQCLWVVYYVFCNIGHQTQEEEKQNKKHNTENIIDNPETLTTLGTRHRRKKNKTKNTTQKT
jgi:hypothetical protein